MLYSITMKSNGKHGTTLRQLFMRREDALQYCNALNAREPKGSIFSYEVTQGDYALFSEEDMPCLLSTLTGE